MTILGLGVDVVEINRFKKIKNNKKIIKRIFTTYENRYCENKNKILCFAKRFAAKEAAAKALGTGFRKGVYWKDLEVINLPSGKPSMNFYGESKKRLDSLMPKNTVPSINLSITDEFPYAQAIVTINADNL